MPTYYYHCTDGQDLLVDRSGGQARSRSEIRRRAQARARTIMRTLPAYEDWARWVVSVHDADGRLVDTIEFPVDRIQPGKRWHDGAEEPRSVRRGRSPAMPVHPERGHGAGDLLWRSH